MFASKQPLPGKRPLPAHTYLVHCDPAKTIIIIIIIIIILERGVRDFWGKQPKAAALSVIISIIGPREAHDYRKLNLSSDGSNFIQKPTTLLLPAGARPRTAMETLLDPSLARKLELKRRGKKSRNFIAKNAREAVVSPEPDDTENEVAPTAKYGMLDSQRPIPKQ